MKDFQDIYVLPFEDQYVDMQFRSGRIVDQNNNFCFQFQIRNNENMINFLDVINGKKEFPVHKNPNLKFVHEDNVISAINEEFKQDLIMIRGWGNLTGTGGYNLSTKDACIVQDTLADYIIKRLSGN